MRKLFLLTAAMAILASGQVWAAGEKIVARPLAPRDIVTYELPAGTQGATGLFTVGVGQPVYLEALVEKDEEAATPSATWSLDSQPAASDAALAASPLSGVPTYVPGDRVTYDIAGRQLLVPDATGQYEVTAVIGDSTRSVFITAANYVGVGTVGGATPTFPQCGMCHGDVAEKWAETGHSDMLERGLNGTLSSHYGEGCISCHTVGFDTAEGAVNGGFDDVAADTGWEFPMEPEIDEATGDQAIDPDTGEPISHPHLVPGTFDELPAELMAVANIQCESCHGPGSEHGGQVDKNKISVSYNVGTCATCHDSGSHHYFPNEWALTKHASNVDEGGRDSCVPCHSGIGFVENLKVEAGDIDAEDMNLDHAAIGCATCHDPHDVTNEHQIRNMDSVTLGNGEVVTEGGKGMLCMNCHRGRRNIDTYVAEQMAREGGPSSHFGPHHGPQTDMLVGSNAVEYGQRIRSSSHAYAVEDGCVDCHMQGSDHSGPEFLNVGQHTLRSTWDGGTPDDPSDDVHLTEACADCHGPMESFDIPRDDFDGDGKVEGVQTEVMGLLNVLAMALPPLDEPTAHVNADYTEEQLSALFNYEFVLEDGSYGIHNAQYAVGILKASIKDLTGRSIVAGGAVRVLAPSAADGGLVASAAPVGGSREVAGKLLASGQSGLAQNAPNPFNPETEIAYAVADPVTVRIDIHNTLGQLVRTLVEAHHNPGVYSVNWNGRDMNGQKVTGGMYIYTMRAGAFSDGKKMVLMP